MKKPLRKVTVIETFWDVENWQITKGLELFVMRDDLPKHPARDYSLVEVRVNNGTDDPELCPRTFIKSTDLEANTK